MHYSELIAVLRDADQQIRIRYTELYRILCLALVEGTSGSRLDFSGPFARLTYLASRYDLSNSLHQRLNSLRARCRDLAELADEDLLASLSYDVAAVAELLAALTGHPVPQGLQDLLPAGRPILYRSRLVTDYLRVCVISWDERFIQAQQEGVLEGDILRICYADEDNRFGCWDYLQPLLREGAQLNLVRVTWRGDVCYPELIILEPDYLTDISSLASCFQDYGNSAYVHLLRHLTPNVSTQPILLGNLAGQMLDEEVNAPADSPVSYATSVQRFVQRNALAILARGDMLGFHDEAMQQQRNIRTILATAQQEDKQLRRDHLLLEPSFFCEMLGLQGRMDLLQDDFHVLMEQKSGKKEFKTGGHREPHYVQMLLYQALLHYGMHLRNDEISSYLLYSKYPDGLIKEGPAPRLLFEALKIRNQLVWMEFMLSQDVSRLLSTLTPERLNTRGLNTPYWERYLRPQVAGVLDPLHSADPLAKAYVQRMLTFVAREHLLGKIGTPGREASGLAALWTSTREEKELAGNIFADLTVEELQGEEGAVDLVVLHRPSTQADYLPNFRSGESCILYAYPADRQPDARQAILFRAGIEFITTERVGLRLRATQHNPRVFRRGTEWLWAVEHDFAESSFTTLYRSVYSLLSANPDRRQLLLGQRQPRRDENRTIQGDYSQQGRFPHFNRLVLQAAQARDYFILIGPPGTGKTSFGLMNILHEELLSSTEGVLLLSYTNRAVDEICSKLVEEGLDFIRLGALQTCPEVYRPYLLSEQIHGLNHISQMRQLLMQTSIVVGTTTTVTGQQDLFLLRSFGLAIIDEASQILEPHLLGILCARHGTHNAVRRFVLIGDHKQLPAVVQQEPQDSQVLDPLLHAIGLMDCRESLFQRLLRNVNEPQNLNSDSNSNAPQSLFFRFTCQGRMHPQVAEFANRMFYAGQLGPVPLPHQQRDLHFTHYDASDPMQQLLAHHRVLFLPAQRPVRVDSPKVNVVEGRMIAQVVHAVYRMYTADGRPFLPLETVGVIVPYRHQIAVVRRLLADYEVPALQSITIDTVERYQGSQRDVIVYGFTVQYPYQMAFLCSQAFQEGDVTIDRKLNVALTRAREQMVLIGNPEILSLDPLHRQLVSSYSL